MLLVVVLWTSLMSLPLATLYLAYKNIQLSEAREREYEEEYEEEHEEEGEQQNAFDSDTDSNPDAVFKRE
jgi:hypothetical protein